MWTTVSEKRRCLAIDVYHSGTAFEKDMVRNQRATSNRLRKTRHGGTSFISVSLPRRCRPLLRLVGSTVPLSNREGVTRSQTGMEYELHIGIWERGSDIAHEEAIRFRPDTACAVHMSIHNLGICFLLIIQITV
jgi:hypothetical protein